MKKLIRLLLLTFFTFSFSQLAYCSDFFTYTNKDYGFSIDIPANWSVTPKSELPKEFQLLAVSENLNATLSVCASDRDSRIPILSNMTITNLNNFVQGFNTTISASGDFQYVRHRIAKISPYDCIEFIYDKKDNQRMVVLIFFEDSCILEMYYLFDRKGFKNLIPSINASLASLKFFPAKILKA